jgi:hypothetical protein
MRPKLLSQKENLEKGGAGEKNAFCAVFISNPPESDRSWRFYLLFRRPSSSLFLLLQPQQQRC